MITTRIMDFIDTTNVIIRIKSFINLLGLESVPVADRELFTWLFVNVVYGRKFDSLDVFLYSYYPPYIAKTYL